MRLPKAPIIFLILLLSLEIHAQEHDARLWLSAGVEKKMSRQFSAVGKVSARLDENISALGSILSDVGVHYRILKNLRIGFHYRYSVKRNNEYYYAKRSRYYVNLRYKIKTASPFSIILTSAYQKEYKNRYTSEEGQNPANVLRGGVTLSYTYKKYEPYIGTEIFYYWNYSEHYTNRIRGKLGTEYTLNKKNKLELYYMIQQKLNEENPSTAYILAVGYKYIW